MTQEQKDLLLKDLCCRLPYGVKMNHIAEKEHFPKTLVGIAKDMITLQGLGGYECVDVEHYKPYLFPMSSMTEEQKKECNFADDLDSDILDAALSTNHYHRTGIPTVTYNLVDWCTENHFDYRGLIPMGLAKDATGLGIY